MLSQKQAEYWREGFHRWNIKCGATRSGKTYMDYYMIPRRIREVKDRDGLVVILGNTKGTLQRNLIEPMQRIWTTSLVSDIRSDNTAYLFGEKCYCLGADNIRRADKIRGASIKYCYGDEIVTWSQDVFEMLKSRLDKSYSRFDGTCNPGHPYHWLKKFIESGADVFYQQYAISDNPFLDPTVRRELEREHTGIFYRRNILGEWCVAEGIIYKNFSTERHVVPTVPREYSQFFISCDYGTYNPAAFLLWGEIEGRWYLVDEYYHSGRESQIQLTDEEYYKRLEELAGDRMIREVIIDPSAASMIATIKSHGRFTVKNADNDVLDGIRNVSSALQSGLIAVNNCCVNTIKEFSMYAWDDKASNLGEDRPLKINDHAMDALRYFVRTVLFKRRSQTVRLRR